MNLFLLIYQEYVNQYNLQKQEQEHDKDQDLDQDQENESNR